jgi:hypothetical protein
MRTIATASSRATAMRVVVATTGIATRVVAATTAIVSDESLAETAVISLRTSTLAVAVLTAACNMDLVNCI